MCSTVCPNCGKEMEEVVGFAGYVWCRDCHITEKIENESDEKRNISSSKKFKT